VIAPAPHVPEGSPSRETPADRRVALVTGAARGIGQAAAVRLAADGHLVALTDKLPADQTAAQVKLAGGEALAVTADLGSPAGIGAVVREVTGHFGRCDVLVNSAGLMIYRPLADLDLDTWRLLHAVNVEAPFQLCKALVPWMAPRGFGRVINVASSTFWKPPGKNFTAYIATKGALIGFTRALAAEVGDLGITVNAVCPGLTRTPGAEAGNSEQHYEEVRLAQPVKRTTTPADLAGTIAYLASDDAALVTGQAIRVDGGLVTL
jgi:NAD(P)-dependent dehydrogenase (short-subunit alcohol dehydrogenase family)